MPSKKKRETADPELEPMGLGYDGDESLTGDGVALKVLHGQPVFVPLRVSKLPPYQLELVAALQGKMMEIVAAQRDLSALVDESREAGLSWSVIGWCIGRTESAVSKRFGRDGA